MNIWDRIGWRIECAPVFVSVEQFLTHVILSRTLMAVCKEALPSLLGTGRDFVVRDLILFSINGIENGWQMQASVIF